MEQLERERLEQSNMRAAARKAGRDVLTGEGASEQAERVEAGKRAGGAGFFERRRIWKAEKLREKQLRESARAEVESIREKERRAEDQLGQTTPPDDSEVRK